MVLMHQIYANSCDAALEMAYARRRPREGYIITITVENVCRGRKIAEVG